MTVATEIVYTKPKAFLIFRESNKVGPWLSFVNTPKDTRIEFEGTVAYDALQNVALNQPFHCHGILIDMIQIRILPPWANHGPQSISAYPHYSSPVATSLMKIFLIFSPHLNSFKFFLYTSDDGPMSCWHLSHLFVLSILVNHKCLVDWGGAIFICLPCSNEATATELVEAQ